MNELAEHLFGTDVVVGAPEDQQTHMVAIDLYDVKSCIISILDTAPVAPGEEEPVE